MKRLLFLVVCAMAVMISSVWKKDSAEMRRLYQDEDS